jgi:hypothetical protein
MSGMILLRLRNYDGYSVIVRAYDVLRYT